MPAQHSRMQVLSDGHLPVNAVTWGVPIPWLFSVGGSDVNSCLLLWIGGTRPWDIFLASVAEADRAGYFICFVLVVRGSGPRKIAVWSGSCTKNALLSMTSESQGFERLGAPLTLFTSPLGTEIWE